MDQGGGTGWRGGAPGWERQTGRKGCPHSHTCGAGTSLPLWQPRQGDTLGVHSTGVSRCSIGHTHTPQPSVGSRAGQQRPGRAGRAAGSPAAAESSCHRLCPSHPTSGQAHTEPATDALCRRARPATTSPPPSWQRRLQGTVPGGSRQRHAGLASSRAELTVSIPQASPSARGHIHQPRNADVLQVCPTALAPGLPGAALGSPSQRLPGPWCPPYPQWWPGLSVSSGPCSG